MIVAAICAVTIATAGPAAAHTGFESSVPADGDVVGEPVREITVTFSGPAEPAGEGFAIIDPAGDLRSPDSLDRHDDRTWRLNFDEPLSGGVVGVRWRVQAPDAHPIEGSFSFTVETSATVGPVPGADQSTEPGNIVDLDAFLNGEGSSSEVGGASLRSVVSREPAAPCWGSVHSSSESCSQPPCRRGWLDEERDFLIGRMQLDHAAGRSDRLAQVRDLVQVGAGSDHAMVPPRQPAGRRPQMVWAPGPGAATAFLGGGILLVGYLFDGHTVTEGNRLLTATSDLVHVLGAAVWVGGLLMLVSVLRHRRGRDLDTLHLAARFSVAAALAVVDDVAALWTTSWGRLLMVKVAFVAVAAGIGAYNHRVLVPAMEQERPTGSATQLFRKAVTIESAALGAAVVITALLVGAAS